METMLYHNKDNSRKHIAVRHYNDGHYVWAEYIEGNNGNLQWFCGRKNFKRRFRRVRREFMNSVVNNSYVNEGRC